MAAHRLLGICATQPLVLLYRHANCLAMKTCCPCLWQSFYRLSVTLSQNPNPGDHYLNHWKHLLPFIRRARANLAHPPQQRHTDPFSRLHCSKNPKFLFLTTQRKKRSLTLKQASSVVLGIMNSHCLGNTVYSVPPGFPSANNNLSSVTEVLNERDLVHENDKQNPESLLVNSQS